MEEFPGGLRPREEKGECGEEMFWVGARGAVEANRWRSPTWSTVLPPFSHAGGGGGRWWVRAPARDDLECHSAIRFGPCRGCQARVLAPRSGCRCGWGRCSGGCSLRSTPGYFLKPLQGISGGGRGRPKGRLFADEHAAGGHGGPGSRCAEFGVRRRPPFFVERPRASVR
jgi:hypothetical protein